MIYDSLLIANRGEIACRIIQTAQEMGIRCIAVYVDADKNEPFVHMSDQSIRLTNGGYLDSKEIIKAAKESGAHAIHPGYGFLSENASFARKVIKEGLIWVGPSPHVISVMGDKLKAKELAEKAGVPTLPMTSNIKNAKNIGFPLLIKAAAGGGGKGMRIVEKEKDVKESREGDKEERMRKKEENKARRISIRTRDKFRMLPSELKKEKMKAGLEEDVAKINEDYKAMFETALECYGIDNIRDLPEEKKAEFFKVVDIALEEAKMAKKDHDGDGKVETSTAEYMGSRNKAIKKAMKKEEVELDEGSETWEDGYKRRVIKTTKPEHKDDGYNWRIKGKDRPEISIKLYKEKPSQAEFNKQMKRVAGHEFG